MKLRKLLKRASAAYREVPKDTALDLSPEYRAIVDQVTDYTMTTEARLEGLLAATDYVVRAGIEGAFVECGVWRGGSTLAVILRLLELGVRDRPIYLYDTFEGMPEPSVDDVTDYGPDALDTWRAAEKKGERAWSSYFNEQIFNESLVRERLLATGYPEQHIHMVKGKVEDTVVHTHPDSIAVLRLDTDWYESTRVEMNVLYPQLQSRGVLIVDDYGHWKGCRKAVDEYFAQADAAPMPLLHRVDYTCRQGIKP